MLFKKAIFTSEKHPNENYKVNIQKADNQILGVVSNPYKIVQNYKTFAFTDSLLNEGVTYETKISIIIE